MCTYVYIYAVRRLWCLYTHYIVYIVYIGCMYIYRADLFTACVISPMYPRCIRMQLWTCSL